MIFTQLPPTQHLPAAGRAHYAPLHSSPLAPQTPRQMNNPDVGEPIHFSFSPRNDTPATPSFASSRENNPVQPSTSSPSSRSKTSPTYGHRYASTISNPLANASNLRPHPPSSSSPSARDKRRRAFLNRVKADRDAGRLEDRADQFMWLEHAAEQREWGEEMERRAEGIMREFGPGGQEDEVYDEEKGMNFDEDYDSRALEEYLVTEETMELGLTEDNSDQAQAQDGTQTKTQSWDFGSFGDEEYDHIFLNLEDQSQTQGMDMSTG